MVVYILSGIIILMSAITLVLLLALLKSGRQRQEDKSAENIAVLNEDIVRLRAEIAASIRENMRTLAEMLESLQRGRHEDLRAGLSAIVSKTNEGIFQQLSAVDNRMRAQSESLEQRFDNIRQSMETASRLMREENGKHIAAMREENSRKLDELQKTVDEKLQTELQRRIRESFSTVSDMLERVQKDIGSMRTLAEDVGGLKKTLSNVKTRGMMGEFLLENILSDIFAPEQYIKNAKTVPESNDVVEFAIKIPTQDDDYVLLPIDSKFPKDAYEAVFEASERGDKAAFEAAARSYVSTLKGFAATIAKKYLAPPYTMDFAIMFLPTESMYAEAINRGMLQELWQLYRIYVTGPSTVSALLSSMQLAFNNIAIQKRAGEVFGILSEVKAEFAKFDAALQNLQKHLNSANTDLNQLMTVRSAKINKRLGSITKLAPGALESE